MMVGFANGAESPFSLILGGAGDDLIDGGDGNEGSSLAATFFVLDGSRLESFGRPSCRGGAAKKKLRQRYRC